MIDVLAGPAPPGETPQVSPRQLAAAQQASAKQQTSASANNAEVSTSGKALHAEVPMIRQVAPESSSPSLQPSTSEASIIRFLSTMAACVGMTYSPLSVQSILIIPSLFKQEKNCSCPNIPALTVSITQESAHVVRWSHTESAWKSDYQTTRSVDYNHRVIK